MFPFTTSPALSDLRSGLAEGSGTVLLACFDAESHAHPMFCVDESTAEAIRRIYNESGEFSAAVELRRHFPGITDNANARLCVRIIASWQPVPAMSLKTSRKRRTRSPQQPL
jgi:hypothetical protein